MASTPPPRLHKKTCLCFCPPRHHLQSFTCASLFYTVLRVKERCLYNLMAVQLIQRPELMSLKLWTKPLVCSVVCMRADGRHCQKVWVYMIHVGKGDIEGFIYASALWTVATLRRHGCCHIIITLPLSTHLLLMVFSIPQGTHTNTHTLKSTWGKSDSDYLLSLRRHCSDVNVPIIGASSGGLQRRNPQLTRLLLWRQRQQ